MSSRTIEDYRLPASSMANARSVKIVRYGDGTEGPRAYIQAGLHADEAPGYLVMHHLLAELDRCDEEGRICGPIVLVPVANPIGVSQWRHDGLQGRFNFTDGVNFNRSYPDLAETVAAKVRNRLGDTADTNIHLIRQAFGAALAALAPEDEAAHLKHKLMRLAHDADIILDLHSDYQAAMHVYIGESLWPAARDLSAWLGATVTLLADDSGVTPFDEACSRIWWRLAEHYPEHPIPPACLAATIELRGQADLSHPMAHEDARNIIRFLAGRGVVADPGGDPPPLVNEATPLSAVEHLKAPMPGVVVFFKNPGDWVSAGDVVAEIINPLTAAEEDRRCPVQAQAAGIIFARSADRFARPGRILAKIAGSEPLKAAGQNLLTL